MPPTSSPGDLSDFHRGCERRLWQLLGAHPADDGARFSVWAPRATAVGVAGDWNDWVTQELDPDSGGVWRGSVPGAEPGNRYRFEIVGVSGSALKADPMARRTDQLPSTVSIVEQSGFGWNESPREWAERRRAMSEGRLSVYEVHLGSWRRHADGHPYSAAELASVLPEWVAGLGFTHVELMPVTAHPFGGSWGYQVTGYFAPDPRLGKPDDLRVLIEAFHSAGIGVILDWVPAHFPADDFALADFDGAALYEHPDPRRGIHADWDTRVFDYARPEVRSFLLSSAFMWLQEFRADGLRVDAVASMLYRDYSRIGRDWLPHPEGGQRDLDAVSLLRQLNAAVGEEFPGALMVAEESTLWPGVTTSVDEGGLGFTHKWNMGWMHDTLSYVSAPLANRQGLHDQLVKPSTYSDAERWILPLGHDEVVHLKGSLLAKGPGNEAQRLSSLRALLAWQWCHPGDQLLFMGAEMAQPSEWNHDAELPWWLAQEQPGAGMVALVSELNRMQECLVSLWSVDAGGFIWLESGDRAGNVFAFLRHVPRSGLRDGSGVAATGSGDRSPVVVVANFSSHLRYGYRVGVPEDDLWHLAISTEESRFGGSATEVAADDVISLAVDKGTPWQGQPCSLLLTLPPLSVVVWSTARVPPS